MIYFCLTDGAGTESIIIRQILSPGVALRASAGGFFWEITRMCNPGRPRLSLQRDARLIEEAYEGALRQAGVSTTDMSGEGASSTLDAVKNGPNAGAGGLAIPKANPKAQRIFRHCLRYAYTALGQGATSCW